MTFGLTIKGSSAATTYMCEKVLKGQNFEGGRGVCGDFEGGEGGLKWGGGEILKGGILAQTGDVKPFLNCKTSIFK